MSAQRNEQFGSLLVDPTLHLSCSADITEPERYQAHNRRLTHRIASSRQASSLVAELRRKPPDKNPSQHGVAGLRLRHHRHVSCMYFYATCTASRVTLLGCQACLAGNPKPLRVKSQNTQPETASAATVSSHSPGATMDAKEE